LPEIRSSGDAGFKYYGMVHNIERFQRDIEIAYSLDPQAAKSMRGGTITVMGGSNSGLAVVH
jgi:hypothetical protein